MARSKSHLLAKNWFTGEPEVRNEKKHMKQGTNSRWLRTRKRIRNKILR